MWYTKAVMKLIAFLVITVAVLGLVPAVVCAMPPDCPMPRPSAADECCAPLEGWAATVCQRHLVTVAPVLPAPPVFSSAMTLSTAALVALTAPEPAALPDTPAPAASAPRFLLTHTFRL